MTIHGLSRRFPLSAAAALLLAGIFVACGPADESVQQELRNAVPMPADQKATSTYDTAQILQEPVSPTTVETPAQISSETSNNPDTPLAATHPGIPTKVSGGSLEQPTVQPTETPTLVPTVKPSPVSTVAPTPTLETPTLQAKVNQEEKGQETDNRSGQEEKPTVEPTERTPLIHCLTKPDGTELCRSFKPDPPGKYPELLSMNKQATRAEEMRSKGARSSDVPVAIVWIKMATEAQGVALEEWLATKGLTEYDWSLSEALDFYKNNRSGIFSASDGEVFAVMPADWLIDISKREGFVIVEPGCQVTRCVGYGQ